MPRLSKPRINPLPPDEWPDEGSLKERARLKGRALNIFQTLANHPTLLDRWMTFGNYILFKSTLPAREREILILRIGWLCQSEYEFGQHTLIGLDKGLTAEEIESIKMGPDHPGWSESDRLLLLAADELHTDSFISDLTWEGLKKKYSEQQLIDIVFTVGQYNLVSMALNTFGVQLDEGVPGF